jgi:excisionase family DNA binding protein
MNEVLTPEQVAQRLQVKPTWFYEQTRRRGAIRNPDRIPFFKIGRYIRFDAEAVMAWLDRQSTKCFA